jgi:hypothetical protein
VCASQQNTCPAPVPACNVLATTPITPDTQGLCLDIGDLDALEAACSGGPDTATCKSAFTVLNATNPDCAKCMTPFDTAFNPPDGIFLCLAPGENAPCNHQTACADTCLHTACDTCDPAVRDQCIGDAENGGGACDAAVNDAINCVVGGDQKQLQLCDPQTYGFAFGTWLRAVGRHFCGSGP